MPHTQGAPIGSFTLSCPASTLPRIRHMQTLAQFSVHLARLIPAVGTEGFVEQLVAMLKQMVSCDDATVILYPGTDLPIIEYRRRRQELMQRGSD